MKLFLAPCRFCGYNGEGFYQKHTHDKNCPFYEIGGRFEREIAISELMPQMYRRISALEAENKALRGLWNPYPATKPPSLNKPGQTQEYIVATKEGYILNTRWLCSDRWEYPGVVAWIDKNELRALLEKEPK